MSLVNLNKTVELVTFKDLRILEDASHKANPKKGTCDFSYHDLKFIPDGAHFYNVYRKKEKEPFGVVGEYMAPAALLFDGHDVYFINSSAVGFFK